MAPLIPHIHLLCLHPSSAEAFKAALEKYKFPLRPADFTIHVAALSEFDPDINFDLIVSPANSYAFLDGGFDDAISRAFSPKDDYGALTRVAQTELYRVNRGYLPPGQCLIVKMPPEWRQQGRLRYNNGKGWGCGYLALCPTMRMPSPCDWDKEVVYECVWSLLNAIERANREADADETGSKRRIDSILMTPLGTGAGGISNGKWAGQTVLAMKHYTNVVQNPEAHVTRNWEGLARMHAELLLTTRHN